ncbi:MAG: hypothetical protein J0L75_02710 [Spirochaetes bacterium]|nr:hypothetical protein [Spirochaetota bacterium]
MIKIASAAALVIALAFTYGCQKCVASDSCNGVVSAGVSLLNESGGSATQRKAACEAIQASMDTFRITILGIDVYAVAYGSGCQVAWK